MALSTENNNRSSLFGLSICAGVGGLDLGLHIAEPDYETICFVEREAYASSVLVARMADAALCEAPIWDDVRTFDGRAWRGLVDILVAGYPCQPFSSCGQRKGEKDERHLWPEIARIAQECQPPRIFLENVEGHVALGFSSVLNDLETMGYRVAAGLFSARECGASHNRRRLFILADAHDQQRAQSRRNKNSSKKGGFLRRRQSDRQSNRHCNHSPKLDHALAVPQTNRLARGKTAEKPLFAPTPCDYQAWERTLAGSNALQPCFFGLDHGMAYRMERSYVVGNGVVPLAAAIAYRTLALALNS